MARFISTAVLTGLLFALMDGVINGNAYAVKLMDFYKPIAKQSVNIPAALSIDLIYGFVICFVFTQIHPVLPTDSAIIKGLCFGLGLWFFRVAMGVVSNWVMFDIPITISMYLLLTGLIEMMLLGILNGIMLKNIHHYFKYGK